MSILFPSIISLPCLPECMYCMCVSLNLNSKPQNKERERKTCYTAQGKSSISRPHTVYIPSCLQSQCYLYMYIYRHGPFSRLKARNSCCSSVDMCLRYIRTQSYPYVLKCSQSFQSEKYTVILEQLPRGLVFFHF